MMHNPMYGVHGDIRKSGQSVIQVDCHYSSSTPSHTTTTPPVRLIHLPPHLPFYPSPLVSLSLRLLLSLSSSALILISSPPSLDQFCQFFQSTPISDQSPHRISNASLLHRYIGHSPCGCCTPTTFASRKARLGRVPPRHRIPLPLSPPLALSVSSHLLHSSSPLSSLPSSLLLNSHRRPNGYPRFDHHHCCRTPNLRLRPPFSYQLLLHHHHSLQ